MNKIARILGEKMKRQNASMSKKKKGKGAGIFYHIPYLLVQSDTLYNL